MNEDLTVEDAKQDTQRVEIEIAESLPAEYVAEVEQRDKGVLLTCSSDGGEQWTGFTRIALRNDPDPATLIQAVSTHFADSDQFSTELREDSSDQLLNVAGPGGALWIVRARASGNEVLISSSSPCFRLPQEMDRRGDY